MSMEIKVYRDVSKYKKAVVHWPTKLCCAGYGSGSSGAMLTAANPTPTQTPKELVHQGRNQVDSENSDKSEPKGQERGGRYPCWWMFLVHGSSVRADARSERCGFRVHRRVM